MAVLPPRLAERPRVCGVRRELGESDGRIAAKRTEAALDARCTRESAIEQRQSFDLASVRHERRVNRINAAERELLTHRLNTDLAHLVREPLRGRAIDIRGGAMPSLLFVSANERADT